MVGSLRANQIHELETISPARKERFLIQEQVRLPTLKKTFFYQPKENIRVLGN